MNLIPNWRQAWRWWSVRVSALGTLLLALAIAAPDVVAGAWALLPAEVLAILPRNVALIVPLMLQAGTGLARILRQRGLAPSVEQAAAAFDDRAQLVVFAAGAGVDVAGDVTIRGSLKVPGNDA